MIGYCSIAGDILHYGHIRYLKKCRSMCFILIVGVMTDRAIKKYKGQSPIMTYKERVEIIQAIKYVDRVVPQNELSFLPNLLKYRPDRVFDTKEHSRPLYTMLLKRTKGISSSIIKERIIEAGRRRTR